VELKTNLFRAFFILFFVYRHLIYLKKVKLLLSKIKNTELLVCVVSFQFPGDSEYGDGGSDNDGGSDEEDDENSITNSLSPYSTAMLLTIIKQPVID
jgi:hypothetical protein